jgi:hypothetical protein
LVVPVSELNYATGDLYFDSPDGKYHLAYDSGVITIRESRGA